MNEKRALFVGRFNPFHLGHLRAVEEILTQVEELIIVVGSTQESHTFSNPFTAGERILMIKEALKEAHVPLDRIYIVTVPDIHYYSLYVEHLRSYCPPFDIAYSNNPLMKRLFTEAGILVKPTGDFNRKQLQGTRIRECMMKNYEWERFLPSAVVKVIKSLNGIRRLNEIISSRD
ncbi:MAG: nicotinamide-nucleotide adenylyltransferase [Candidatus Heimdallarchaeota archaeon]